MKNFKREKIMCNCKDLNSLLVLSLYEGEIIGQVNKLYFDKKLKKLMLIELLGEDGVTLTLNTKNIYHIGKNAITVKNKQCVGLSLDMQDYIACPVGCKAYNINGEYLGIVQEIGFNAKYQTEKIWLENSVALDVNSLATVGKNTIIFYAAQKVNMENFEPKPQPAELKTEEVVVASTLPIEEKAKTVKTVPTSSFLLGRVCTKDIYNFNNKILIRAESVVNKKNLKEINKYGKIKELMLYLK